MSGMPEPLVCCVMLTRDRPEMVKRAVDSFRSQTYKRKKLLIYNQNTAVDYGHIPSRTRTDWRSRSRCCKLARRPAWSAWATTNACSGMSAW